MEKFSHHCFEFGPFVLDVAQCLLLKNGDQILLTPKTFDTLRILVENGGRVVHKDEMMNLLWPDSFVEEANLAQYIALLRKSLGEADSATKYIETIPKRGYRFIAEVRKCDGVAFGPDSDSGEAFANLEPVGGAVPLDSRFYVERPTDMEFHAAIARHDSIVLVKGARQVGKSSLLSRGLQRARQAGNNVIITDFQALSASHLQSPDKLFLTLAELTADQLELDSDPAKLWNPERAASVNLQLYLRREVLSKTSAFLVWGLDEVDCLFRYDYASEVFALFRSWHNARALDPAGPWQRLTLAMAYATEAHMFITDLNQSPFNVGTRLMLDDFTVEHVAELNRRYGSPLKDSDLRYYYDLVGGHPYLVRKGLNQIAAHGLGTAEIESQFDHNDGLFGDHLRRMLISITQSSSLSDAVREILCNRKCPTTDAFYRLRSAGIAVGDSTDDVRLRCRLYESYLKKYLS